MSRTGRYAMVAICLRSPNSPRKESAKACTKTGPCNKLKSKEVPRSLTE